MKMMWAHSLAAITSPLHVSRTTAWLSEAKVAGSIPAGPMFKMDEVKKELSIRVKEGDQFYSNETAIHVNPSEIVFDFKCINQVQDIAEMNALVLKHNIVIMTPQHAKSFAAILDKVIKDYEDKFGAIEKTKHQKKADEIMKKAVKDAERKDKKESTVVKSSGESYFG